MIFDTHSHYDDEAFDPDREELLEGFASKGIGTLVTVGANLDTSRAALDLAKRYDYVYAALGVHPSETGDLTEDGLEWIRRHASETKVLAIGEIGLDYHWDEPAPEVQKLWFEQQIALAKEVDLPIIIHSRDAAEETMKIIRATKAYVCGGVVHCYSYSSELARELVDMGYFIGVGGVVTFKNGRKLKEAVKAVPIEHIVLETDCPYLSPEPHRGKRNDSTNLFYVAEEIAKLKGMSKEEVIAVTEENARRLYRMETTM